MLDLDNVTDTTTTPRGNESDPLRDLGITTDLLTAARILGVGRTKAYQLARTGKFPVPLVRVGRTYRVTVAHLAAFLGLDKEPRGQTLPSPAHGASIGTARNTN